MKGTQAQGGCLDDAVAAFNPTERINKKTIICVYPRGLGDCLTPTKVQLIHAPKESLDVEHDYTDRFLSHA